MWRTTALQVCARERSAKESAKENRLFAKDMVSWIHTSMLTYSCRPAPVGTGRCAAPLFVSLAPCLRHWRWESRKAKALAGTFWGKFRERSAKDRRACCRFRAFGVRHSPVCKGRMIATALLLLHCKFASPSERRGFCVCMQACWLAKKFPYENWALRKQEI